MEEWIQPTTAVSLTYSSADAPTFVASTAVDITGSVSPGMRLRISQATGGTKYFIVTAITSSTITLYGGTDYTLNNETISSPVFSSAKAPVGFPLNPEKWTFVTTDNQSRSQVNPTNNTWYNLGSLSLAIHIGIWSVEYFANMDALNTSATSVDVYCTLSTSNNSESDTSMTSRNYLGGASGILDSLIPTTRRRFLSLTSKTTYYLNAKSTTSPGGISFHGEDGLTIIRAVCAYL